MLTIIYTRNEAHSSESRLNIILCAFQELFAKIKVRVIAVEF